MVIWFIHVSSVNIHIALGLAITLILLVFSVIALMTRGMRRLGVIGILYTCILPGLGLTQYTLLVGNLHWLVQVFHLLIGLGSVGLIHVIGARYLHLQPETAKAVSEQTTPQVTYKAS
jgi:cytochrome bd-type quinol oxidase subunit 2